MVNYVDKNPKACEPCRKRKTRCDGGTPCQRCQRRPFECAYRQRTRMRKLAHSSPGTGVNAQSPPDVHHKPPASHVPGNQKNPMQKTEEAGDQLYQSVAATLGNEAHSIESSRLFYGPSSQFAFLQQLYRGVLCSASYCQPGHPEVQEGGPGLDLFVQRSIFFGTAQRTPDKPMPSHTSFITSFPIQQAVEFLAQFKATSSPVLPMFTDMELDDLLCYLYSERFNSNLFSQSRAVILAVLAVGALATVHTDLAELLLTKAKQEATICDDVVSLATTQFYILLAEYQINIGRPTAAYLNLGVACRRAFAMGLHKESDTSFIPADILQKRRITLWCLYFHESWQALALGRESSLKMSDISTPFPEKQTVLVGLCRLAQIAEDGARMIYGCRYDSLDQLYVSAEKIRLRLDDFAEHFGIGSTGISSKMKIPEGVASLQLHNVYYHVILLTYRPFLVAESALKPWSDYNELRTIWLRQACRYATDAAQDAIVYTASSYRKHNICKAIRYNAFFIDATCVVLLYDMLRRPAKWSYNSQYIQMALQSLGTMVHDEPVTVSQQSIQQMLHLVRIQKDSNSKTPCGTDGTDPATELTPFPHSISTRETSNETDHQSQHLKFQLPSLSTQQCIYFSDFPVLPAKAKFEADKSLEDSTTTCLHPPQNLQNEVVTTDLFDFIPLDLGTLYRSSNVEIERQDDD